MQTAVCNCEHAAHFDQPEIKTPNGNPGHEYGVKVALAYLTAIETTYGAFTVCENCATDCHNPPQ